MPILHKLSHLADTTFRRMLRAVNKFRISALHSSRLTAAYESTPHSPLVARLDLHNFSSTLGYTLLVLLPSAAAALTLSSGVRIAGTEI